MTFPPLSDVAEDGVELLVVGRLGEAGDETGRQILAVSGLLLERAEQDTGRGAGTPLAAHVGHEILPVDRASPPR